MICRLRIKQSLAAQSSSPMLPQGFAPRSVWAVATLLVVLRCGAASAQSSQSPQHLVPSVGAYFGVSIDFGEDTVASYVSRVGLEPAVYNIFIPFPLDENATEYLASVLPQIAEEEAIAMLTVMPNDGLDLVTVEAVTELAEYILPAEQVSASAVVRGLPSCSCCPSQWGV